MKRRRTLVSAGFAAVTGALLFTTAGSAAADDGRAEETVLRIVRVQAEDHGCPGQQGSETNAHSGERANAGAGAADIGTGAL